MKKTLYILLLFLSVLIGGCEKDSTRNIDDFSLKIDSLLREWETDKPGGAVGVIIDGDLIYEQYFGLENINSEKPFGSNTLIDIGSISKQITACLIAILEEENKLSIEDDIRTYIPELNNYVDTIKIKHLIFHTSGIRDYEALETIKGNYFFEEHMTNTYVVNLIARQQSLNFKPNSKYEYSNSNYILLAEIVQRVSGRTLNEVAKEKIFSPLKMNKTFFHINQGKDFENRAIGYDFIDGIYKRPIYKSHLIGDGGIFTTLTDLMKWDSNFYKNKLGNKNHTLIQRMEYRENLLNGSSNNMAFAQIYTSHPFGKNSFSHGGSGGGYRSFYIRFEDSKFSVIVLSNSNDKNAFHKANQIVNYYFNVEKNSLKVENVENHTKSIKNVRSTVDLVKKFKGLYRQIDGMDILEVDFDNENQEFIINWLENRDNGYKAVPISDIILAESEDSNYQYVLDTLNNSLVHYDKGQIVKKWKKLNIPSISVEGFKGKYYSSEVEHQIELSIFDGKLYSKNIFLNSLRRISNSEFLDEQSLAIIKFELMNNKIKGFSIDIPQGDRNLRGLKFKKRNE